MIIIPYSSPGLCCCPVDMFGFGYEFRFGFILMLKFGLTFKLRHTCVFMSNLWPVQVHLRFRFISGRLPAYSPFLNIVEQAVISLTTTIKGVVSRPEIQARMDDRAEVRRLDILLGKMRTRLLLILFSAS